MQDGIDWTQIEIVDNTQCLNLFEKVFGFFMSCSSWYTNFQFPFYIYFVIQKPLGLLSLLDEESAQSSSNGLTFINKLKKCLNGNPCFKEKDGAIGIFHYAGQVSCELLIRKEHISYDFP